MSEHEYIHESLRSLALPISELTPDPKNARLHNEKNIAAVKASLDRFGMRSALVAQRSGEQLVVRVGNGRLQAAKELGWTHLPVMVCEEGDEEAMAFALADNKTAQLAEWDPDGLHAVFEELGAFSGDLLEVTGFDTQDVSNIISGLDQSGSTEESREAREPSTPPESFPQYDENLEVEHRCPRCSYAWSGKPSHGPK